MWHVYILKCADHTLYTGITTDLERRIKEHNDSKLGAKYSKARRPVELVYAKNMPDRSQAAKEESRIKKLSRQEKLALIKMTEQKIDDIYLKFLGQSVTVIIDRPLHSKHPKHGFAYELNYGYVPDTLAPDGEEVDAYIIGVDQPIENFTGRCVAIVHRLDDQDDKLIVVPDGSIVTDNQIIEATHFQEQFFQSVIYKKVAKRKCQG